MNKKLLIATLALALATVGASSFALAKSDKANQQEAHVPVCAKNPNSTDPTCHSRVIVDGTGSPKTAPLPSGYGPAQFRGAYSVSGTVSTNQTIAIVDAYDNPNVLADLNYYSSVFGIPGLSSCPVSAGTPAHPCFQKVNQNGGATYPSVNSGWALESSLDVQAAHAMCQNCNILLVEASSNSYANLMTAVDRARLMNAKIISNSYGSNEFSGETAYDSHFNYPGIAFTFSSGDSGYGASYPAASPYVTSVGGTTLKLSNNNAYLSESAWSGSGSGCSTYEAKPLFQTDTGCLNRMIADVSADADPNTGAAVYMSTRYNGRQGWFKVGGTSLAAPLIAATYALNQNVPAVSYANSLPYLNIASLHDVTTDSNGTCSTPYLCSAVSGYDGPTGLGSPNGTNAF